MRNLPCSLLLLSALVATPVFADHPVGGDAHEPPSEDELPTRVVTYGAAFFARYEPNSALDMVNQVPGFQLDDGQNVRGFANAAGNVLINSQRPSVKQDSPAAILGRIPAGNVVRIELIRGQTTSIDLQGQQVVVNVVLHEDSPATVRWEAYVYDNTGDDVIMPGGGISLADRWSDVDVNLGLSGNRHAHNTKGSRNSYATDGSLLEDRSNDELNKHLTASANFSAAAVLGKTQLQVNSKLGYDDVHEWLVANRVPQDPGEPPFSEKIVEDRKEQGFELGISAERALRPALTGKAILIFIGDDDEEDSTQRVLDESGNQALYRVSAAETDESESIARVEFDWTGLENHHLQFNAEYAFNALEGALVQTVDDGTGPVPEAVPGANTRVEESRVDLLVADTWRRGAFELNVGLGAEASEITQTGDAELRRDFFFVKPHAVVSYSPQRGRQTRVRVAREVSQLDFSDFVSATVFQDDDLALGNPNLRPETTWVADVTHERRFGDIGVVKLRAYHDWIDDVEDLLPLTPDFEAPGNIGDGRRWGVEIETTLPLDRLGLAAARVDLKARWQDSEVTDPVTGTARELSVGGARISTRVPWDDIDVRYLVQADFRQDFEAARVAWGFSLTSRAERRLYKVDELDAYDEGLILNPFVETTRWGVEIETTLPLDRLGLAAARLDLKARWQDSAVTDPVTGAERELSVGGARISTRIPWQDIDVRYLVQADLRQDFEAARVAWGFSLTSRAERRLYKVDELDVYDEGLIFNPFVETTRWLGLKIQLRAIDLVAENKTRRRTIYSGQRGLSPIQRIELTDVNRGRQFELVFTGSF